MKKDYEIMPFQSAAIWRKWLDQHSADTDGLWLKLYKKDSGVETVSYPEALDEALCYGWIDGQSKSLDDKSYLQKFTPRRKASLWSKVNIGHVQRLSQAGRMMPRGIEEVERAKSDGRWQAAYDKPSEMVTPDDFLAEIEKRPRAKAFFETLNKSNRFAIAWRLQTAKTETTRQRRLDKIIDQLESGQKLV